MSRITFTDEQLLDAFEYLDSLRTSGVTNMNGATPYIQRRFGYGDDEAIKLLLLWQKTFSRKAIDTVDNRVAAALALLAHEVP
jgi:hypothetical protein